MEKHTAIDTAEEYISHTAAAGKLKYIPCIIKKTLTKLSTIIEYVIAVLTLIVLSAAAFSMIRDILSDGLLPISVLRFKDFLSDMLILIIGLEFIKMLIRHTPGSAIEVLLFALIREMIVYHTSAFENLAGVAAVAGLFAIKKFLFVPYFEEKEGH